MIVDSYIKEPSRTAFVTAQAPKAANLSWSSPKPQTLNPKPLLSCLMAFVEILALGLPGSGAWEEGGLKDVRIYIEL